MKLNTKLSTLIFLLLIAMLLIAQGAAAVSAMPIGAGSVPSVNDLTTTTKKTLVSIASEDGWILETSESSNLGGYYDYKDVTFFVGDNKDNRQARGFLSFNTSDVPSNATIVSAKIRIRQSGVLGTNPYLTHGAFYCDLRSGWFGGSSALAVGDFKASASLMAAGYFVMASDGWYNAVLPSKAFPYINKEGITQCRLRFNLDDNNDKGNDLLSIYSSNSATAGNRPVLILEYKTP
jgi:hypothetical protein